MERRAIEPLPADVMEGDVVRATGGIYIHSLLQDALLHCAPPCLLGGPGSRARGQDCNGKEDNRLHREEDNRLHSMRQKHCRQKKNRLQGTPPAH